MKWVQLIKNEKGEFGISAILSIAVGLILTAFVLIPGIRSFANMILTDMQMWWQSGISSQVFPK